MIWKMHTGQFSGAENHLNVLNDRSQVHDQAKALLTKKDTCSRTCADKLPGQMLSQHEATKNLGQKQRDTNKDALSAERYQGMGERHTLQSKKGESKCKMC